MILTPNLSEEQANFVAATTRGRIYLGSIGSGKTVSMCYSAIFDAWKSYHVCIVSFSYRNLKDVVIPTMLELIDSLGINSFATYRASDNSIAINGAPILFRTADNPDRLRGLNLDSFYIEEAREVSHETFLILLGRLRRQENCHWGLVSTTRGKNWFYNIIKKEGLLDVFKDGNKYESNENLTVCRSEIDDSPFLPEAYKADLKKQYSSRFAAQELRGLIIDGEGEVFKEDWFKIKSLRPNYNGVRFWDLAVTTKTGSDSSASCKIHKEVNKFHIDHMSKFKLSFPELKKKIIEQAKTDTTNTVICVEEAGQQRAIIDDLRHTPQLSSFVIRTYRPTKDKVTRAYPVASQAELGNIILDDAPWTKQLFDEFATFNIENCKKNNAHDDMVDAMTGAYHMINRVQTAQFSQIPM